MPAASPGTGYARSLRLGGSRDPPAAFGVWRVMVWNAMVLSRYVLAEFQGANTGGLRTPADKCRPPG